MAPTNITAYEHLGMAGAQLEDVTSLLAIPTVGELDQPSLCRG